MSVLVQLIAAYAWLVIPLGAATALYYLVELNSARRQQRQSLFGLEREQARHRQMRAALMLAFVLGTLAIVAVLTFAIAPRLGGLPPLIPAPTDAGPFVATPPTGTPTARPTATATVTAGTPEPTATGGPTAEPTEPAEPTAPADSPTPAPGPGPAAGCGDPNQYLSAPAPGSTVSGIVPVYGTADIPGFVYYKFEISGAATGGDWVTTATFQQPVRDGLLGSWDTAAWAPGAYQLRLVVVDNTGNFPTPCVLNLTVAGSGP
jgi:hypothetical protein